MAWTLAKAFIIGGGICLVGQLVINFTKLTNGKLLVVFLIFGGLFEIFGWYSKFIAWAGAGASVPISGFGSLIVRGAINGMHEEGFFGAIRGGLRDVSAGVSLAIVIAYIVALVFSPRTKTK